MDLSYNETGGFLAAQTASFKPRCTSEQPAGSPTRAPNDIGPVHNCQAGRGPANNCSQGGADYAILRVNNPSGWNQARGWVFVRASGSNDGVAGTDRDPSYPITNVSRVSDGWRVCKSGRHSTSCGRIFALGYSYTSNESGYSYSYLARARYCQQDGDSGGPVYAYNNAYGIHHGGNASCSAVFQSVVDAQNGLNVNVILQ